MARNGSFRRPQVSAAALRDPVAMIDHGVAILTLMLFLFLLGGVTFAAADTALFGAVGGGQAGFNWQTGALVVGVEGDFDWSNPKGSIRAMCGLRAASHRQP